MFTPHLKVADELVAKRGPRYCTVASTARSHVVRYHVTAADAEAAAKAAQDEGGYTRIRTYTPDLPGFDIDFASYSQARTEAQARLNEATQILRAAVVRAVVDLGRAEAEVARAAGVDRMTVRKWTGK